MIRRHRERLLPRGERADRVCAGCGRPFAFDPRPHGPHRNDRRIMRTTGLPPHEAGWLHEGRWSPLAAVPPARFAAVVVRAVQDAVGHAARRHRAAARPEGRRAVGAGFPTRPEQSARPRRRTELPDEHA